MAPTTENAAAPATPAAATAQPTAAQQQDAAQQEETKQVLNTVAHDLLIFGLAAAAFFIKNKDTQGRAGNVLGILQGLELFPTPGN